MKFTKLHSTRVTQNKHYSDLLFNIFLSKLYVSYYLWWIVMMDCVIMLFEYSYVFFFLDIYKCHQCSAVRSAVSGLHQKGDTLHWCHGRHFRHPPGGETDKAGGEAERCKNEHTAWYHSQEKKILYTYLRWSSVIDKKMPVQWTHIWFWASWFIIQREQHIYKAVLSLSLL